MSSETTTNSAGETTLSFDAETTKTVDGETYTVSVHVETAPETFPEGTTMTVEPIQDQEVLGTISDAVEGEVTNVSAVSVTFTDENGDQVQPQEGQTLNVTLSDTSVAAPEATTVVQYSEEAAEGAKPASGGSSKSEKPDSQEAVQELETIQAPDLQAESAEAIDTETSVTVETTDPSVIAMVETTEAPADTDKETDPAETETPAETDSEQPAEPAQEGETAEEPAPETPAEEAQEEVPEEEVPVEPLPVLEQMEELVQAYTMAEPLEAIAGEGDEAVLVRAEYLRGVFPEGVELKAELIEVEDDYANAAIDAASGVSDADSSRMQVKAVDITFLVDGEEVQPEGDVKITLQAPFLSTADTAEVVHMDNEGNGTVVASEAAEADAVSLTTDSFSVYAIVYTVDFHYNDYEYSIEGGTSIKLSELFKILEIPLTVDQVADVTFSDPDLVEVTYTQPLFGTVGDWTLTSLAPFQTEETLHLDLKDGTSLDILVTDAQILKDYLSADGNTYHIEVTLDDKEVIDGEADLVVEELTAESDNYEEYMLAVAESMSLESPDDISFARFFDITILVDGKVFEPEYPAQVKIAYDEAIEMAEGEQVSIVHFADAGTEVIQAVDLSEDGTALTYEQGSFSVTAMVVASNKIQDGNQYVIYTKKDSKYYAMTHDSEGRDGDLVYGVEIEAKDKTGKEFTEGDYGSSIVWTARKVICNGTTYYTFSYEEGGKTYYLRTYGGLMVGADSDINEDEYTKSTRYEWRIQTMKYDNESINNALRNRYSQGIQGAKTEYKKNEKSYYLSYSASSSGFKERDKNKPSSFYFAEVSSITQVPTSPTIHYVDENGNELQVVNGRDWTADSTTTPAYLVYDIEGYEYVKTTLQSVGGDVIRPILRKDNRKWQYTTSTSSSSVTWTNIPADTQDTDRLEDIYVVYKRATEPVNGGTPKIKESGATETPAPPGIHKDSTPNGDGTNTLSLSITADTSPLEVEKLADVIVIFDVSNSMDREMMDADNQSSTRLEIAKDAVNELAEKLIGDHTEFQDSAGNKLIRMSLISFSKNAKVVQTFTDQYSDYKKAVDNLTRSGGTNWEDALRMANSMEVDPERATFVIFVTDGNPSYRVTRGNLLNMPEYPDTVSDKKIDIYKDSTYYQYRKYTVFGALDEMDERNYNTALDVAKSIVDHKKNFYAIGVGPEDGVSRLRGLTTYAYGGSGADRTKNAKDSVELTKAFDEITASIVALLGWGDITMTDGITALTNTVEKSHLTNVDGNFEYWKAPAPAGWEKWSKAVRAAYIKGTSGADATYQDSACRAAYNKGKELLSSGAFSKWNPETENCNAATYDEASGSVKWDMGHSFVPESGCTYKVTFKAWPSQEAYDILAKCRNDSAFYNTLTNDQKAQIIKSGDTYILKTNDKEPKTTYMAARKTGDGVTTSGNEKTLLFNDVIPLNLASHTINVKKIWNNELNDGRGAAPLLLGVRAIGTDNPNTPNIDESVFSTIRVSEDTQWKGSSNISTGLLKVENGKQTLYEHGHDFTLTEDVDPDAGYYWELTADTYRPMVITDSDKGYSKPTPVMLKKVSASEQYDYVIDSSYYKIVAGTAELTATNNRRSNLNLTKQVVDKDNITVSSSQPFEFKIQIDDPADKDIWFSVQTGPDVNDPRVMSPEVTGATTEMKDGSPTGYFYVADNDEFTVKLQPGWNLRFTNLLSGTKYTITETVDPDYTFVSAAVDNDGTFAVTSGTTTGIGTIDQANTQYTVTYKNHAVAQNVSIWKTDMGYNTITTGAEFALYSKSVYEDETIPIEEKDILKTGKTGPNGILTLDALAVGEYYLVETEAPAGYIKMTSPVMIKVNGPRVTATQGGNPVAVRQEGEPFWVEVEGQSENTWQIQVHNNPGTILPATGGIGTKSLTLAGTVLVLGAALGLGWKRRQEG